VYAEQVAAESGVDELLVATMRFPGDVLAEIDCGLVLPVRDELEAIGEEGSLFLDDPWHCRGPVIEHRTARGVERIELEPEDSYKLEMENLGDAIRGEAAPLLGREDALGQARAIEALYRAAEEGRAVRL
jgi:predicted dehydrogenase